jgi:hypothetical protein
MPSAAQRLARAALRPEPAPMTRVEDDMSLILFVVNEKMTNA